MAPLKCGLVTPFGDARFAADLAYEAEQAGWDGLFIGEAIWHVDAWVALAAAAMRTERIRLGTMLSPLPALKPWKLAAESASLDNLSNGRVIVTLGTGAVWMGWQAFPEYATDIRTRAEQLDEGIDILSLLYRGKPFDYDGKHYQIRLTAVEPQHYPPPPIQQPRIPIWVVGVWPRMRSMRRALRCDGLIPAVMNPNGQFADVRPDDVSAMKAYIDANRTLATPFDIVVEGQVSGLEKSQMIEKLGAWRAAGATWWLESLWGLDRDQLAARVRGGPPQQAEG
jgi:alkanesulfonate monooxygenase SsuD/methylene tetrahydromethanopterin reductase-like flavin-dependent oxidoreductase (luciferase family)